MTDPPLSDDDNPASREPTSKSSSINNNETTTASSTTTPHQPSTSNGQLHHHRSPMTTTTNRSNNTNSNRASHTKTATTHSPTKAATNDNVKHPPSQREHGQPPSSTYAAAVATHRAESPDVSSFHPDFAMYESPIKTQNTSNRTFDLSYGRFAPLQDMDLSDSDISSQDSNNKKPAATNDPSSNAKPTQDNSNTIASPERPHSPSLEPPKPSFPHPIHSHWVILVLPTHEAKQPFNNLFKYLRNIIILGSSIDSSFSLVKKHVRPDKLASVNPTSLLNSTNMTTEDNEYDYEQTAKRLKTYIRKATPIDFNPITPSPTDTQDPDKTPYDMALRLELNIATALPIEPTIANIDKYLSQIGGSATLDPNSWHPTPWLNQRPQGGTTTNNQ